MEEFRNQAEQLFYHYKETRLPVPSLRKQFQDSGYLETVYDDFRNELVVIKSRMVSSADESQQCNAIIESLLRQLRDIIGEEL
jgi:hypothetical protein